MNMNEINHIQNQFYGNITLSIVIVFLFIFVAWISRILTVAIPYWRSSYYKSTHKSFLSTLINTGDYGEYLTYNCLRKYESDGARFLFNCYLPKDNEETTEIDVMMIYKSGIYVFESKNYSGWIFGSESNKMWTQSIQNGRSSRKERFYNPIMQNRTHITWLEKQVDDTDPLHSIVVFSQRCELKKLEISSGDITVIKRDILLDTVKQIDERVGPRLTEDRISLIYDKLFPFTQVADEIKERHIETIKNNSVEVVSVNKCPKCGGQLILRTASHGQNTGNHFYGCSNYPQCRYIRNVDNV